MFHFFLMKNAALFALALVAMLSAAFAEHPQITLPVRVHLVKSDTIHDMHTTLTESDVHRILGKVNAVWGQAGIRFEIESIVDTTAIPLEPDARFETEFERVKAMIPRDRLSDAAIDICYVKSVRPNGFYYGEPIVVKDTATLRPVTDGLDEPLPRVTSHEIGHALGLPHRQELTNLMASGTTGFSLNDAEIAIARAKATERVAAKRSPLIAIGDIADLPRVLLIGDSVSMGYTLPTRALLAGKANVHRPPTNCGATSVGLAGLDKWLGEKKWDVIHFNFGLHDAKLPPEGVRHSPPDVYEKNLRELVARLRTTGAKLIWATTTPVPNGGNLTPTRRFGSVERYNAIAKKVMEENGVAIDDLHAAIAPQVAELQRANDVHFTDAGSELLAKQVAASIAAALGLK